MYGSTASLEPDWPVRKATPSYDTARIARSGAVVETIIISWSRRAQCMELHGLNRVGKNTFLVDGMNGTPWSRPHQPDVRRSSLSAIHYTHASCFRYPANTSHLITASCYCRNDNSCQTEWNSWQVRTFSFTLERQWRPTADMWVVHPGGYQANHLVEAPSVHTHQTTTVPELFFKENCSHRPASFSVVESRSL